MLSDASREECVMHPCRAAVAKALFLTLVLATGLFAMPQDRVDDHAKTWRGMWIATAGQRTFRGRWWATKDATSPNAANGSWTLLSDSNQIVLEGTWSAKKSARGWQGTWTARTGGGSPFSGSWISDVPEINAKTFADLLSATASKQVAGSWRKGRLQGGWWLQGGY